MQAREGRGLDLLAVVLLLRTLPASLALTVLAAAPTLVLLHAVLLLALSTALTLLLALPTALALLHAVLLLALSTALTLLLTLPAALPLLFTALMLAIALTPHAVLVGLGAVAVATVAAVPTAAVPLAEAGFDPNARTGETRPYDLRGHHDTGAEAGAAEAQGAGDEYPPAEPVDAETAAERLADDTGLFYEAEAFRGHPIEARHGGRGGAGRRESCQCGHHGQGI